MDKFDQHQKLPERGSNTNNFFTGLRKRFLIAGGVLLSLGIGGLILVFFLAKDLPSLTQLENFDPNLITRIYSSDGVVIKQLYTQRRVLVPLEKIPPYVVNALLATEDQKFYSHWGVNVLRNAKALMVDAVHLSWVQGASTITQQLARNLYEAIGFRKTVVRKMKEAVTAIQIERTYTKHEIVEMYLNTIFFGHGLWGIEAASREYYNKRAEDLTLDEAATLIGLLRYPNYYNPLYHPERARSRRNVVLKLMHQQGYISEPVYAYYASLPIITHTPNDDGSGIAPYFTEYIRQQLEQQSEALGIDPYRDGLSIYTTLDTRVQAAAEASYQKDIATEQGKLNTRLLSHPDELASIVDTAQFSLDTLRQMIRGEAPMDSSLRADLLVQGALISMDPRTGKILAMIGGRDFATSKFNRATQAKRQPGSVFKPFIYTAAIDNGIPVTKQLLNQPVVLIMDDSTRWMPQNYEHTTGGPTTLRDGLRLSLNLIAVRLVQQLVAPPIVVDYAHRMGITTPLRAVDAIALGTSEVIPIEVTAAYSIFANHGIWTEPYGITRIEDRFGNLIKAYTPMKKEVLSEETAYIMADMLKTVLKRGTGRYAVNYGFTRPGGGKTGTTQDFTDAWFVGFTPQIATGVWVGVDNPSVSLGPRQSGAVAALPMWAPFMAAAHDTLNLPVEDFVQPEGVVRIKICSVSKKLPTPYCPTETEIFNRKYMPTDTCDIHGPSKTQVERGDRRTF